MLELFIRDKSAHHFLSQNILRQHAKNSESVWVLLLTPNWRWTTCKTKSCSRALGSSPDVCTTGKGGEPFKSRQRFMHHVWSWCHRNKFSPPRSLKFMWNCIKSTNHSCKVHFEPISVSGSLSIFSKNPQEYPSMLVLQTLTSKPRALPVQLPQPCVCLNRSNEEWYDIIQLGKWTVRSGASANNWTKPLRVSIVMEEAMSRPKQSKQVFKPTDTEIEENDEDLLKCIATIFIWGWRPENVHVKSVNIPLGGGHSPRRLVEKTRSGDENFNNLWNYHLQYQVKQISLPLIGAEICYHPPTALFPDPFKNLN